MNLRLKATPGWRQVAVVEVPDDTIDFPLLIRDDRLQFQVRLADESPCGNLWYGIYVDPSFGERRAELTAHAVMTALTKSSDAGHIKGFRIVSGERWLLPGSDDAQMTGVGMTSGDLLAA